MKITRYNENLFLYFSSMLSHALLTILYTTLFSLLILRLPFFKHKELKWYVPLSLFLLKILSSAAITGIYTFYYSDRASADIYKYFDDSGPLFDCLLKDPATFWHILRSSHTDDPIVQHYLSQTMHWQLGYNRQFENSHRIIILFNVFCRFFSFGHIMVHNVFMNFLSFSGLWALWLGAYHILKNKSLFILAGIFLIPDTLFWGSGLLKEGLVFFFMGFAFFFWVRWMESMRHWYYGLGFMLAMFCLLAVKSYIALGLAPFFAVWFILHFIQYRFAALLYLLSILLLFVLIGTIHKVIPGIDPVHSLNEKIYGFREVMAQSPAKSAYDIGLSDSLSGSEIISNVPQAWMVGAMRPFPWEAGNIFSLLVTFENLVFWALLPVCVFLYVMKGRHKAKLTAQEWNLFFFILSFTFVQYVLIGLTAFNFGAMIRYKTPCLPFWFLLPVILISMVPFSRKEANQK